MATNLELVAAVVRAGLIGALALMFVFVLAGMFNGRIRLVGILSREAGDATSAAERSALLAATLGYAFYYVGTALHTPLDPAHPSLPEISDAVIALLFGSNGLYLAGKMWGTQTGG